MNVQRIIIHGHVTIMHVHVQCTGYMQYIMCAVVYFLYLYRSVNTQMKNGATAAYLACQFGHLDILKCLVEKNANVKSIKTFDGMSCLHAACQGGHLDIVKYLVSCFFIYLS